MPTRKKKYLMTFTYEVVVEATDTEAAEEEAFVLVADLQKRFHAPKHRSSPVIEAGFRFNEDIRKL